MAFHGQRVLPERWHADAFAANGLTRNPRLRAVAVTFAIGHGRRSCERPPTLWHDLPGAPRPIVEHGWPIFAQSPVLAQMYEPPTQVPAVSVANVPLLTPMGWNTDLFQYSPIRLVVGEHALCDLAEDVGATGAVGPESSRGLRRRLRSCVSGHAWLAVQHLDNFAERAVVVGNVESGLHEHEVRDLDLALLRIVSPLSDPRRLRPAGKALMTNLLRSKFVSAPSCKESSC